MDELVKAALGKVTSAVEEIPWDDIKATQEKTHGISSSYDLNFTPYIAKAIRCIHTLESALRAL